MKIIFNIIQNKMSYRLYGKRYADYFPEEYAYFYLEGTGPHECSDCSFYGRIGGIFMGYCVKCSEKYNGYRGPGIVDENSIEENRVFFKKRLENYYKKRNNFCRNFLFIIIFMFIFNFFL